MGAFAKIKMANKRKKFFFQPLFNRKTLSALLLLFFVVGLLAIVPKIFSKSLEKHGDYKFTSAISFYGRNTVQAENLKQTNTLLLVPVVAFKSPLDELKLKSNRALFQQRLVLSEKALEVLDHSDMSAEVGGYLKKNRNAVLNGKKIPHFLEKNSGTIAIVRVSELRSSLRVLPINDVYFYEVNKIYFLSFYGNDPKINGRHFDDESGQIFTFAQTGVTALTRGVQLKINKKKDPLYISKHISAFLRQFDLTHTSNEVSFAKDCQFVPKTMRFCSPWNYFKILKACGFDIIELTGNHNNDYGFKANLQSLQLYRKNGMRYFGGGKDLQESQKILYLKTSKAKLNRQTALLGYNEANVVYKIDLPLAKEKLPGANPFDMKRMESDIRAARKKASTVIVDFQFAECYAYKPKNNDDCYLPMTNPDQKKVFRKAIDFGADIVVGTQAHQPQVIEKYKKGVIFYGLGNLFFDQIRWEGTRQGMILVHVFFNGVYKTTIVYPTYYDKNMQVHLVKGKKKKNLLDIYYQRRPLKINSRLNAK